MAFLIAVVDRLGRWEEGADRIVKLNDVEPVLGRQPREGRCERRLGLFNGGAGHRSGRIDDKGEIARPVRCVIRLRRRYQH
jgi:hypothetical protein